MLLPWLVGSRHSWMTGAVSHIHGGSMMTNVSSHVPRAPCQPSCHEGLAAGEIARPL